LGGKERYTCSGERREDTSWGLAHFLLWTALATYVTSGINDINVGAGEVDPMRAVTTLIFVRGAPT
jgi:hypothetical protein